MFITGPDVVKTVTGEEVTLEDLGRSPLPTPPSRGVATFVGQTEEEVLDEVRFLVSHLPAQQPGGSPRGSMPPTIPSGSPPSCADIMPDSPNLPYDMRQVIQGGGGRRGVHGVPRPLGPVHRVRLRPAQRLHRGRAWWANQPMVLAGVLDIESSSKAARFVRTCDAFNITAADPGGRARLSARRRPRARRHHPPRGQAVVRLLRGHRSPASRSSPRKAYGGAYVVMDSKSVGLRPVVRLDRARRVGRDGPAGGGGDHLPPRAPVRRRSRGPSGRGWWTTTPSATPTPTSPPERGYIDDVIDPADTRRLVIAGFEMLRSKREELLPRKHGIIPL